MTLSNPATPLPPHPISSLPAAPAGQHSRQLCCVDAFVTFFIYMCVYVCMSVYINCIRTHTHTHVLANSTSLGVPGRRAARYVDTTAAGR